MISRILKIVTHAPHLAAPIEEPQRAASAPAEIERAGPMTKMKRLIVALEQWHKAGRPIAPRAMRKARADACKVCPYWDAKGNWGWGECAAPGCGCTKFKIWLLTETCPHPEGSRWPAV